MKSEVEVAVPYSPSGGAGTAIHFTPRTSLRIPLTSNYGVFANDTKSAFPFSRAPSGGLRGSGTVVRSSAAPETGFRART